MTYDRTYWRQCSLKTLIETSKESRDELAIALGERLEEYEAQEDRIHELLTENADFSRMVDSLRDDIEYYRTQLGLD